MHVHPLFDIGYKKNITFNVIPSTLFIICIVIFFNIARIYSVPPELTGGRLSKTEFDDFHKIIKALKLRICVAACILILYIMLIFGNYDLPQQIILSDSSFTDVLEY